MEIVRDLLLGVPGRLPLRSAAPRPQATAWARRRESSGPCPPRDRASRERRGLEQRPQRSPGPPRVGAGQVGADYGSSSSCTRRWYRGSTLEDHSRFPPDVTSVARDAVSASGPAGPESVRCRSRCGTRGGPRSFVRCRPQLEDRRFVDCEFVNCHLSLTTDVTRASVVRRVELTRCRVHFCSIGPGLLEDVSVEQLGTSDLLLVWGALFSRVKFSGPMGRVKLNPFVDAVDRTPRVQRPLDELRERHYRSVDWALDIREARFIEFDFRGIPARLVRRDPESQVVVKRESALKAGWREKLSPSNKLLPFMIGLFLQDGDPDTVLVAPLGAPKSKREELLRHLGELRQAGVAEPD